MIDSNFIKINSFKISNVSRETLKELDQYSKAIIERNKNINLISKSTEISINTRHIQDSAQTIDFIDKNEIKICCGKPFSHATSISIVTTRILSISHFT